MDSKTKIISLGELGALAVTLRFDSVIRSTYTGAVEELRIPKIQVPIVCFTTHQETIFGEIFLDVLSASGYTTNQILDFFNSSALFFPLRTRDTGKSILMQKESLVRVDVPDLLHEYETEVSSEYDLKKDAIIHLRTAGEIRMKVIVDMPSDHARILDVLNGYRAFIPVLIEQTFALIHRRHIYKVEEL